MKIELEELFFIWGTISRILTKDKIHKRLAGKSHKDFNKSHEYYEENLVLSNPGHYLIFKPLIEKMLKRGEEVKESDFVTKRIFLQQRGLLVKRNKNTRFRSDKPESTRQNIDTILSTIENSYLPKINKDLLETLNKEIEIINESFKNRRNYALLFGDKNERDEAREKIKKFLLTFAEEKEKKDKTKSKWDTLLKRYMQKLVSDKRFSQWAGEEYIPQGAVRHDDKSGKLSPRDIIHKSKERDYQSLKGGKEKVLPVSDGSDRIIYFLENSSKKKIVIFGEPGIGKTTTVERYCHRIAKHQLENNSLEIIPVFVGLKSRTKKIKVFKLIKDSLKDVIIDFVDMKEKQFYQLLGKHNFLLIFDGFNELTSENIREEIQKWLTLDRNNDIACIITTRKEGFPEKLEGFEYFEIQRFVPDEIREFLDHHYNENTDKILEEIDKKCLNEISDIPFYLNAIGKVYSEDGELPRSRGKLLDRLVQIEYLSYKEGLVIDGKLEDNAVLDILSALAFESNENEDVRWEQSFSSKHYLNKIKGLKSYISEPDIVSEKIRNSGLVLNIGGQYFFPHQIFSEYFAALGLIRVLEYRFEKYEDEGEVLNSFTKEYFEFMKWDHSFLILMGLLNYKKAYRLCLVIKEYDLLFSLGCLAEIWNRPNEFPNEYSDLIAIINTSKHTYRTYRKMLQSSIYAVKEYAKKHLITQLNYNDIDSFVISEYMDICWSDVIHFLIEASVMKSPIMLETLNIEKKKDLIDCFDIIFKTNLDTDCINIALINTALCILHAIKAPEISDYLYNKYPALKENDYHYKESMWKYLFEKYYLNNKDRAILFLMNPNYSQLCGYEWCINAFMQYYPIDALFHLFEIIDNKSVVVSHRGRILEYICESWDDRVNTFVLKKIGSDEIVLSKKACYLLVRHDSNYASEVFISRYRKSDKYEEKNIYLKALFNIMEVNRYVVKFIWHLLKEEKDERILGLLCNNNNEIYYLFYINFIMEIMSMSRGNAEIPKALIDETGDILLMLYYKQKKNMSLVYNGEKLCKEHLAELCDPKYHSLFVMHVMKKLSDMLTGEEGDKIFWGKIREVLDDWDSYRDEIHNMKNDILIERILDNNSDQDKRAEMLKELVSRGVNTVNINLLTEIINGKDEYGEYRELKWTAVNLLLDINASPEIRKIIEHYLIDCGGISYNIDEYINFDDRLLYIAREPNSSFKENVSELVRRIQDKTKRRYLDLDSEILRKSIEFL